MNRFLKTTISGNKPLVHLGLLVGRVVIGLLLLTHHGYFKLQNVIAGDFGFQDPIGIGTTASLILSLSAEFFCSLFLILGLFSRYVLVGLIINMGVATYAVYEAGFSGHSEHPFLFLMAFLILFSTGPGKYSLDRIFFG